MLFYKGARVYLSLIVYGSNKAGLAGDSVVDSPQSSS